MSLQQYYADIEHFIQQAGADWLRFTLAKKWKLNSQMEVLS